MIMSDVVIRAENLSKLYRLGQIEPYKNIRDAIANAVTFPFRLLRQSPKLKLTTSNSKYIWALKDVSFEVKRGEVMGIIGRNGAGKTTLLKILSHITPPTEGYAEIHGRVGSLLEVGTGFHPELTGRENIYLSGAILGMKKAEIKHKFDEIVAFAELEKFIDTPIKRYSSGMYVRLAFSVAAHLEPEILLVDEVLAVGDVSFQKKCLGQMDNVAKEGRTILFVSHNMAAINRLCRWCMWIDEGRLRMVGTPNNVVSAYLAVGAEAGGERRWDNLQEAPGNEEIRVRAVRVLDSDGEVSSTLDQRFPFSVEIEYDILSPLSGVRVGFVLLNSEGVIVFGPNDNEDIAWQGKIRKPGRYKSICTIPGSLLNSDPYTLTVCADMPGTVGELFSAENVLRFQIEPTGGLRSSYTDRLRGIICPSFEWHIYKL